MRRRHGGAEARVNISSEQREPALGRKRWRRAMGTGGGFPIPGSRVPQEPVGDLEDADSLVRGTRKLKTPVQNVLKGRPVAMPGRGTGRTSGQHSTASPA